MVMWRLGMVVGILALVLLGAACETSGDSGGADTHQGSDAAVADDDDPDAVEPVDDAGGGGGGGGCEDFCADMVAACPEDDSMETCTHSCELAGDTVSEEALGCAAAATDCTAVRACWGSMF